MTITMRKLVQMIRLNTRQKFKIQLALCCHEQNWR